GAREGQSHTTGNFVNTEPHDQIGVITIRNINIGSVGAGGLGEARDTARGGKDLWGTAVANEQLLLSEFDCNGVGHDRMSPSGPAGSVDRKDGHIIKPIDLRCNT